MRCAIMQPTYLPWAGYFNLISQVDIFIFLDDVQFEKRSWQSRNRVLLGGQAKWLTVPVKQVSHDQLINCVQIAEDPKWRSKQISLLDHAYAKHPYKHEVLEIVNIINDTSCNYLADLNIRIIKAISERLGLHSQFIRASDLGIGGKRSEHLYNICQRLECDEYLSPVGSADYLAEDGIFNKGNIRLLFQNYVPKPYLQLGSSDFMSHLSIIDVIANGGISLAKEYINSDGG